MDYTYSDLLDGYRKLGVQKGRIISLKTDLRSLGRFESSKKADILQAHLRALSELIDLNCGTLVVATSTTSLCNTTIPFDPQKTPSEVGVLTEYIRKQDGAIRSYHPFESYTAIGKHAKEICHNVSRHAYGPETPEDRMIEGEALCVSVGIHPRLSCATVHHIEMIMGVPYRYNKEYIHPVDRDEKIIEEPFYRSVWYRECEISRDENKKIFQIYQDSSRTLQSMNLGSGKLYSYSVKEFSVQAKKIFRDDIFVWLDRIPENKPYRQ